MPAVAATLLPLSATYAPGEQADLTETMRGAYESATPVYPLGGQTALSYGNIAKTPGWGVSTEKLTRVVDYPARDMTITVEAGITLAALQQTLAAENQFLPVDVAQASTATLGGAMAVNFSGPRRFGQGTLRDYVIGVSAVDGTGTPFKAGGRVVKNVAGYDFCKLLTGSLGTLAVITQVTLKVKPRPAASVFLMVELASFDQAETVLAALVSSRVTPTAVELLAGNGWRVPELQAKRVDTRLVVGIEGTIAEVEWMVGRLRDEWSAPGLPAPLTVAGPAAAELWNQLAEFGTAAAGEKPPLVLKLNVRPSRVTGVCSMLRKTFPEASLLAHAGNGIVLARLPDMAAHELSKPLIQVVQPAASAGGGQCVVWNTPSPEDLTRQLTWGPARDDDAVARRVKKQFDPKGLLNPGRYIF